MDRLISQGGAGGSEIDEEIESTLGAYRGHWEVRDLLVISGLPQTPLAQSLQAAIIKSIKCRSVKTYQELKYEILDAAKALRCVNETFSE